MPATTSFSTTRPPLSTHTSDPVLTSFLAPTFDPTAYLNGSLPPLVITNSSQQTASSKALSLSELATRTQTHIAQLSAQNARLTATLTALTDDILRSGSRLTYEVELLRGEAVSLDEILAEKLAEDIERLKPLESAGEDNVEGGVKGHPSSTEDTAKDLNTAHSPSEPPALAQLRTLQHIRAQLQSVITIFDHALSWPLPPSLLSSSLISISDTSTPALETKGQEALHRIKASVTDKLAIGGAEGVLAAEKRIEELRDLVGVWKGTGEEKARTKIVDGLENMVRERRESEERRGVLRPKGGEVAQEDERRQEKVQTQTQTQGRGLLGGLRRLREEIYLD